VSLRKRLKDPFGLDEVMSQHRPLPFAPAQSASRTVYTPAAKAQQRKNAAKLQGGRTYKPTG
jgi:hypothetical protein